MFIIIFIRAGFIEAKITDSLNHNRPRVIVESDKFDKLKEAVTSDTLLQRYLKDVILYANSLTNKPLPEYELDEAGALLNVSRDCLDRLLTLGTAYKMTGDNLYLKTAKRILKKVCDFKDWHYYHFLDVAEMSTAVSIGYDWFYEDLEPDFREEIKESIIRNAIIPGLAVYGSSPWQYWLDVEYNWNQVCNGGLAIAALAIADTDPIYAEIIIPKVLSYIPKAMETYNPNGAWGEGVSYWFYATRYTAYCIGTLESSLGSDFGLASTPGFKETGYFPIHMTTPSFGYFSYADIDMHKRALSLPVMFWLSDRFNNPHYALYQHQLLSFLPATALDVIYYVPPEASGNEIPTEITFDGIGKYSIMRESWDSPENLFVAISGGDNRMNHGHLDKGSFELEYKGVKWVRDLGSDKYHLPGYWEKEEGGDRWKYFRLNTHGHSTIVVNGENQLVNSDSYFEKTGSSEEESFAIIDLTEPYANNMKSVKRGFKLSKKNHCLIVKDEYKSKGNTKNINWQIITEAEIIGEGRNLTLKQDGQQIRLTLLNPNLVFEIESAEQSEPESINKGFKKILVKIPKPDDHEEICVVFSPDSFISNTSSIKSLKEW